jgi:tetratricopeptide (TPR) repeat protein
LTGRPPVENDDVGAVLRAVQRGEFPPPRELDPALDRALEAICLKAMALKPEDRYLSPKALSEDVERWMADEPVAAYREPFSKRAGRWARRHRPLVAGAAVLLVTAVVALTAGTVLLGQANARTDAQRRRADALRLAAEANFQKARQAVDEYFTKVSESKLLNVPGLQPLRKEFLESSRKYYQDFLREHAHDPSVRAEAAEAWYRVGFVTMDINPGKEAMDAFREAADMYDQLSRDHPDVDRYVYKLAMCLNDLGNQQANLGLEPEAFRTHERCLSLRQRIVREHPDVPEYQKALGIGYIVWAKRQFTAGLTSASLRSNEQARDIFERLVREHPDVADYQFRLAGTLQDIGWRKAEVGRTDEALRAFHQSLAMCERLDREHPDVFHQQSTLINSHYAIGWVHYRLSERNDDALAAFRRAKALAEKVARDNPGLMTARARVAFLDHELGRVLVRLGRLDEALTHYRSVLDFEERRGREDAGSVWNQRELGYLHFEIGRLHRAARREPEALESLARARTIFEALADAQALDPYNRACAQALSAGLVALGNADLSPEEQAKRRRFSERAVATLRQAAAGGHHSPEMISSDIDFDAIRSDDGFRNLLAELKAHPPAFESSASKAP